jgi:hypothetical protein
MDVASEGRTDLPGKRPLLCLDDAVEKGPFEPWSSNFKGRWKASWGSQHQMVNLPMTSVMVLRGHRMAIAACFAFQR